MRKNPLYNIVKEDVKVSKEYSRRNTAIQTQAFLGYPFYKPLARMLSRESIVLMLDYNANKK